MKDSLSKVTGHIVAGGDRVVAFDEIGGPDRLRLRETEVSLPAPGEVRIDVRAAGLNRAELMFLAGEYLVRPDLPSKIGIEAAGFVSAVGPGVETVRVGDPVCVLPLFSPERYGLLGTRANVPAEAVVPKPPGLSFPEAAAFFVAHLTAYGGLKRAGETEELAGRRVVVTAASSSAGLAAIAVAKSAGASVVATTRAAAKADRLRAYGADRVVVTTDEDLAEAIAQFTDGRGFDLAFDAVAGPNVAMLASAAAVGATIVVYGLLSGDPGPFPFFEMIPKGVTLTTFHLGFDLLADPTRREAAVDRLVRGLESGRFRTVIDRRFPLEAAAEAYAYLGSNEQVGKVVVDVGGGPDGPV